MFKQRGPRGFQHQYIYVDERKERLKEIETRAKRELGMLPPKEATAEERIRGKMVDQTTHKAIVCLSMVTPCVCSPASLTLTRCIV